MSKAVVHWGISYWESWSDQCALLPLRPGRVSEGVFRWSPELMIITFDVGFWRDLNDACRLTLNVAETDALEASQCREAAVFVRSFVDAFAASRVSQSVGASWSEQSVTIAASDFLQILRSFAQFLDDAGSADEEVEISL